MLIRFDDSSRGPSAALWQGLVDWVRGSLATALGQRDFEDFAPFLGASEASTGTDPLPTGGTIITSETGTPTVALENDRFGVISITESAGTNEVVAMAREIKYDLQATPLTIIEARVKVTSDADSPQTFVGFTNVPNPKDVFDDGAIEDGGTEDTIGVRWNADETFDIVAVDAGGTLAVLKDNVGVTVERTSGFVKIGLRVEKVNSSTYRLVPCINGAIARSGIVNVANTVLPEGAMRPVVALSVAATTAPDIDIDYIYSADK